MFRSQDNLCFRLKSKKVIIFLNLAYFALCVFVPYYYSDKMQSNNYIGWSIITLLLWLVASHRLLLDIYNQKKIIRRSRCEKLKLTRFELVMSIMYKSRVSYFPVFCKAGYDEIIAINAMPYSKKAIGKEYDVFCDEKRCVVLESSHWELTKQFPY